MNKARWVSAAAGTAVLVAGLALPAGAAFADGPSGDGNSGVLSVLSGNDVNAPVSLPVDVCGVAVSLLGGANAGCAGGAASNTVIGNGGGSGGGNGNAGVISAGSGNTVNLPVSAPVSVCGVSGAAAGFSNSGCKGGAASNTVIGGANGGSGNGNSGDIRPCPATRSTRRSAPRPTSAASRSRCSASPTPAASAARPATP